MMDQRHDYWRRDHGLRWYQLERRIRSESHQLDVAITKTMGDFGATVQNPSGSSDMA
jgi:hypothetical protein